MPDATEIAEYTRLRDIVARLHAPDGCPWDREQTHASLRPYLLQEAYEVLHLLDEGDTEHMPEELGDLLCQILMHTQLAEGAGEWAMTDVFKSLSDKLVRRHPHVFGEVDLTTADEVVSQWDEIKKKERAPDASALASVPAGPAGAVLRAGAAASRRVRGLRLAPPRRRAREAARGGRRAGGRAVQRSGAGGAGRHPVQRRQLRALPGARRRGCPARRRAQVPPSLRRRRAARRLIGQRHR